MIEIFLRLGWFDRALMVMWIVGLVLLFAWVLQRMDDEEMK